MKNILLATTAIALTAGYAAAELSITATAKIAYGNFGEEHKAGNASKTATSTEAGGTAARVAYAGTRPPVIPCDIFEKFLEAPEEALAAPFSCLSAD